MRPAGTAFDTPLPGAGADAVNVQSLGIVDILQAHEVNEVILTIPQTSHPEVLDLVALCRRRGIAVSLVPQPYLLYLSKPELVDLGGLPLLQLRDAAAGLPSNPLWKRVMDLALASCLLLPSLPVVLLAAAILKAKKGRGFCREGRRDRLRCEARIHRARSGGASRAGACSRRGRAWGCRWRPWSKPACRAGRSGRRASRPRCSTPPR